MSRVPKKPHPSVRFPGCWSVRVLSRPVAASRPTTERGIGAQNLVSQLSQALVAPFVSAPPSPHPEAPVRKQHFPKWYGAAITLISETPYSFRSCEYPTA